MGDVYLHRIHLYVFDFNQRAISCNEKYGFRRWGMLLVFTPREFFSDSKAFGNPIGSLSRRITGQE